MTNAALSFVGKYIAGRYLVQPTNRHLDNAVASVHEEVHGILRRSSAYGVVFSSAQQAFTATPDKRSVFTLHMLASRSRTSDEIGATYQSLRQADIWQGKSYVEALLERYPTYRSYYEEGHQLVGAEPIGQLANVAIDSILRFCWSARELGKVTLPIESVEQLQTIPHTCYPDARLRRFKSRWSPDRLRDFLEKILGEKREHIRALFSKPPRELADPVRSQIDVPEGYVYVESPDTTAIIESQTREWLQQIAMLEEGLVNAGYRQLAALNEGNDLAAMSFESLRDYLLAARNLVPRTPEIPEIGLLRAAPCATEVVDFNPRDTGHQINFVRRSQEFRRAFDFETSGDFVRFDHSVLYQVDFAGGEVATAPLIIGAVSVDAKSIPSSLQQLPFYQPLAVFASIIQDSPAVWLNTIDQLTTEMRRVWIICDIAPRECIRLVRSRVRELRGYLQQAAHNSAGALLVDSVYPDTLIQGIVFLGSRHALALIQKVLISEMGDDMRGFGPRPIIFEECAKRERLSRAIAKCLLSIEMRTC